MLNKKVTTEGNTIKKIFTTKIEFSNQVWIYYLLSGVLVYIFACYFPFVMEYYIKRPEESLLFFLQMEFLTVLECSYYEMVMLFLLIMIIYSITFRVGATFLIISIAGVILTYASNLKYINRLELLNYTDLKVTEAAGMAMNYLDIKLDKYTIQTLLFVIMIVWCSFILQKYIRLNAKQIGKKRQIIIRMIIGCICTVALVTFHTNFMKVDFAKHPAKRYQQYSAKSTDYILYQFLRKSHSGYTPEEILKNYAALTDKLIAEDKNSSHTMVTDELPAIIVIMSESWWDLENIPVDKVSFSMNPMQPLNDLADLCDIGTTSVNIYGGGTISSEAEFLTGFNSKYFNGTAAIYNDLNGRNYFSVVNYFKDMGYSTTAIHPYYSTFYDRENMYKQMGFDTSIFEDDMEFTSIFDKYISDDSMVNQIISECEKNPSNPNFIFSISIASHSRNLDYETDEIMNIPYAIDVHLKDNVEMSDEDYDDFVHYVNGIYESNVAFAKLVEYFEKQERPVIVLMYGDHCPNFNTATLKSVGMDISNNGRVFDSISDMSIEQAIHTTPFISYNNFSDKPFVMDGENITAISDKLIDYIGLPSTRMSLINKYMRTFLKTDTRTHMIDSDGNLITYLTDEQIDAREILMMIQYDILYGESVCDNLWEPIK